MIGNDGMTGLRPCGQFSDGLNRFRSLAQADEKPQHTVCLDAFWIDRTDVTNAMYAKCVSASGCTTLADTSSINRSGYYGNPQYDNYPVINVDWDMAETYCKWAGRPAHRSPMGKATRGTDGRIYPWGNTMQPDNTLLRYIGGLWVIPPRLAAIPMVPAHMWYLDMAGNVSAMGKRLVSK